MDMKEAQDLADRFVQNRKDSKAVLVLQYSPAGDLIYYEDEVFTEQFKVVYKSANIVVAYAVNDPSVPKFFFEEHDYLEDDGTYVPFTFYLIERFVFLVGGSTTATVFVNNSDISSYFNQRGMVYRPF